MKHSIPDAVTGAPDVHSIAFENETFRVLTVRVSPGVITALHWHPKNVCYVKAGGRLKFTSEQGDSKEVELRAGQITASEAVSHIVENIGTTEVEVIQVELKTE